MKQSDADEIAALKSIAGMLLRQLREVTAEAHAIRVMLSRRGLYDASEYEKTHAESLAEFDQRVNELLLKSLGVANAEAARKLLEMPTGRPQ